MNQLNNNQFQKNSDNYLLLQRFLRYMEAIAEKFAKSRLISYPNLL